MKKSLLYTVLTFILLAPFTVSAQYLFPLVELQKLTAKNPSDFETIMLEKDYTIQTKLSNPTTRIFWSDKAGAEGKKFMITRHQVPNAAVNLTFRTTDKKYYLELKKVLASSGFKFLREETKTIDGVEVVWFRYSNGGHNVSLTSFSKDITWFVVEVHI